MNEVIVPVLDQTGGEVVILRWLKNEGDEVAGGEPLCEIETAKAVVEIESNADGILRRRLIEEGTTVPPRTVLALIGSADEPLPEIDPYHQVRPAGPEPPVPESATSERRAATGAAPRPSAPERIVVSPRAKRLAAEHKVDLSTVQGSGPRGRILEDDIRQAIERASVPAASRAAQAKAQRVAQNWSTIPHFHTTITVDMSRVVERKSSEERRPSDEDEKVTYTDYIVQAFAEALKSHPTLNAHWTDDGLVVAPGVHMGLVVQTERGLVIPVLRDVQDRSLAEIASEREQVVQQAHSGRLSARAAAGATVTLSNLGVGSIDYFTAIIDLPQVAILSVGSILERPLVSGSEIVIRPTAMFTIGVDHRAIDGREAAGFLEELKRILER